jgi:ubiquinone/menaquinone biosynthesis C-methylase UbiE
MDKSAARFNKIASNFATSEVHRSSPTISRLHEVIKDRTITSVCDVACGAGHLGFSFAPEVSRLVAVDPAPKMIEVARQIAQDNGVALNTYHAPAEHLPLPTNAFDLTASRLAPHHFTDVYCGLREMTRVTRSGGIVAVIDLQGHEEPKIDDFLHQIELLHDPTHVRSYTATTWTDIFQRAGLTILHMEVGLSERPGGIPIKLWCEIASSGEAAETEINRLLSGADPRVLAELGIYRKDETFFYPVRTVLVIAEKTTRRWPRMPFGYQLRG